MYSLGIIKINKLLKLRRLNGLDGHPDISIKGIEANTGSLGMGISKAKGMAWSKKFLKKKGNIIVLTGDGEFQEEEIQFLLQLAKHCDLGENDLNRIFQWVDQGWTWLQDSREWLNLEIETDENDVQDDNE